MLLHGSWAAFCLHQMWRFGFRSNGSTFIWWNEFFFIGSPISITSTTLYLIGILAVSLTMPFFPHFALMLIMSGLCYSCIFYPLCYNGFYSTPWELWAFLVFCFVHVLFSRITTSSENLIGSSLALFTLCLFLSCGQRAPWGWMTWNSTVQKQWKDFRLHYYSCDWRLQKSLLTQHHQTSDQSLLGWL